MTTPKRTSAPTTRFERPADLHPLLVDTHKVWDRGGMTTTQASHEVGVSAGAIYGWFMGKGRPMLIPLDVMLGMIGYHYSIIDGARPGAPRLHDGQRRRNASGLRTEETPPDLHPVLVETDELWRATGIPLVEGAKAIGLSRGPMYRWFLGRTPPGLLEVDSLLGTIGKRLAVTRGARKLRPLRADPV